jgi:hypothetical protein
MGYCNLIFKTRSIVEVKMGELSKKSCIILQNLEETQHYKNTRQFAAKVT